MSFDPSYEPRDGLTHRDADWSGLRAERGAHVTVVSRDVTEAISQRATILTILDVDVRLGPQHMADVPPAPTWSSPHPACRRTTP